MAQSRQPRPLHANSLSDRRHAAPFVAKQANTVNQSARVGRSAAPAATHAASTGHYAAPPVRLVAPMPVALRNANQAEERALASVRTPAVSMIRCAVRPTRSAARMPTMRQYACPLMGQMNRAVPCPQLFIRPPARTRARSWRPSR